jgi:hypothetical protein
MIIRFLGLDVIAQPEGIAQKAMLRWVLVIGAAGS